MNAAGDGVRARESLFSTLRGKRQFIPGGFRDDDGLWHDGPHRIEFDAALSSLYMLLGGLTSYAVAPPTNEASLRARDDAVRRAREALGITE